MSMSSVRSIQSSTNGPSRCVAVELRDGLLQDLVAFGLLMRTLAERPEGDPRSAAILYSIRDALDDDIEDVRRAVRTLEAA